MSFKTVGADVYGRKKEHFGWSKFGKAPHTHIHTHTRTHTYTCAHTHTCTHTYFLKTQAKLHLLWSLRHKTICFSRCSINIWPFNDLKFTWLLQDYWLNLCRFNLHFKNILRWVLNAFCISFRIQVATVASWLWNQVNLLPLAKWFYRLLTILWDIHAVTVFELQADPYWRRAAML